MATTLDALLDELQTHRAALDLPQEGAKDFESVNLKPEGHLVASEGRGKFTAQRALVLGAIEPVLALSDACGTNARLRELVMAAIIALQALDTEDGNSALLRDLVNAVVTTLHALTANSDYPDLPSQEAEDAVLEDLDAQLVSMQAYRARVKKKIVAMNMKVNFAAPEKK